MGNKLRHEGDEVRIKVIWPDKWWIFPWRTVSHNRRVDQGFGILQNSYPNTVIDDCHSSQASLLATLDPSQIQINPTISNKTSPILPDTGFIRYLSTIPI